MRTAGMGEVAQVNWNLKRKPLCLPTCPGYQTTTVKPIFEPEPESESEPDLEPDFVPTITVPYPTR